MEPLNNLDISSEDARETGDIDQFDPELIPLQRTSYLGLFQARSSFTYPTINEVFTMQLCFFSKNALLKGTLKYCLYSFNCRINCFMFCPPGFSTDSGLALIRKGELTIVSGAPRGGYSGQVAFLKADPAAQRSLLVEFVLSGPGLASSFGYDLAVVDLNGDG